MSEYYRKVAATTSFDLSQRSHYSVTSFNVRIAEKDLKGRSGVKREVCVDVQVAEDTSFVIEKVLEWKEQCFVEHCTF